MSKKSLYTKLIKKRAYDLGFERVGVSQAQHMDDEARRLEEWLSNGYHGKMSYMENHFDKRTDPSKLVPGAKSVISLSYNYFNAETQRDEHAPRVSMYAFGEDYHFVIKKKLNSLINFIREEIGEVEGRCFVDSAPILERDWAKRSGLGWIGKHTLLISKQKGSFFFLAEIILDLEMDYDKPVSDHCGECTRCIDACPTGAIDKTGYILDANKCISYLTIELKEEIPDTFSGTMENWMFGCDICQQVCPWNRFSTPHHESAFLPEDELMEKTREEWMDITEEVFSHLFKKSAVQRAQYSKLKQNIQFLKKKAGN